MPTVRIAGRTMVVNFQTADGNPVDVVDPDTLKSLDGLEHDEVFTDYMQDSSDAAGLAGVGITGGLLRCSYDSQDEHVYYVTEYAVPRLLTPDEMTVLTTYTVGQWSDGIGANFFQSRLLVGPAPQFDLTTDGYFVKAEQF
jgi:hypothetical protein